MLIYNELVEVVDSRHSAVSLEQEVKLELKAVTCRWEQRGRPQISYLSYLFPLDLKLREDAKHHEVEIQRMRFNKQFIKYQLNSSHYIKEP